jgi:hypothetical protein
MSTSTPFIADTIDAFLIVGTPSQQRTPVRRLRAMGVAGLRLSQDDHAYVFRKNSKKRRQHLCTY